MGFFDKLNNNMIVNAFKQVSNRRDCKIFFHGCAASWQIPQTCACLVVEVEVHNIHR